MKNKYKVFVVEPSALVAKGIESLLSGYGEFELSGMSADYSHCQERITLYMPDIVLLNPAVLDPAKRSSLKNILSLENPPALVAILYSHFPDEVLRQFDETLSVYDDPSQIVRKLRQVADKAKDNQEQGVYELSDREKEILVSVAKGFTNKEIADKYNISIHTVISHRKNLTRKTGIKTVSGLTVYALLNSLLDMSEVE